MLKKILEKDFEISRKFFLDEDRKILRKTAAFFAHSGDSWFWVAGLFLIWSLSSGVSHLLSALLAGAIMMQAIVVLAIKFTIKRRRPEGDWGAIYRNTDPHSFPSGHAARACMLAVLAWNFDITPLNWILTIWAPLVSMARVSLGVHYLSDVIAGWLLGFPLAYVAILFQPLLVQTFPYIFIR